MATQNPIEQEGTYPLPEAQLDRFFFKLVVGYSSREELNTIIDRTTKGVNVKPDKVMDGAEIVQWQQLVREVILAPHVQDYIAAAHAGHASGRAVRRADHEPVPALGQQPARRADAHAGRQGAGAARAAATTSASKTCAASSCRRMRHRVILNFEAEAEGIDPDKVLLEILEKVPEKAEDTKVGVNERDCKMQSCAE